MDNKHERAPPYDLVIRDDFTVLCKTNTRINGNDCRTCRPLLLVDDGSMVHNQKNTNKND